MTAVRPGDRSDVDAVIGLLDGAVAWLVARGRPGQWGTAPFSANPRRADQVRAWADSGGLYVAEIDGEPVGALAVGDWPDHVAVPAEPELYVNLLVTDRSRAGSGIGGRLLARARDIARARGVSMLRVDCYGGDDGALIRYYESQGFTATDRFTVDSPAGPWPGQVLEQRL